jgi:hypothetical protein
MVIATAAGGKARSLWLRPVERAVICPSCSRGFRTVKKEPQSSRKPAALKSVPGDSVRQNFPSNQLLRNALLWSWLIQWSLTGSPPVATLPLFLPVRCKTTGAAGSPSVPRRPCPSALGKTTLTSRWRYLDGNAHFFLRELPHSHPDDVGKKE